MQKIAMLAAVICASLVAATPGLAIVSDLTVTDATLLNEKVVRVSGTITCPEGATFTLYIVVNQDAGAIIGESRSGGRCTGEPVAFTGAAHPSLRIFEPPTFEPGPAQVCLTGYESTDPVGFGTCFDVTL
jgi:hypothetical protein